MYVGVPVCGLAASSGRNRAQCTGWRQ